MSKRMRKVAIVVLVAGVCIIAQGAVLYAIGVRVNTSPSIPVGVYWKTDAKVEKGRYVTFCPMQLGVFDEARRRGYITSGFCPGGYGYLMKRVLGATDDAVTIDDDGVRVNGTLLPNSAPMKADRHGLPLPRFQHDRYILSEHQLLLMSDVNPKSFDSRYYGPVQRSQVRDVIVPVLVW
ncbi:conjugation peptidase TraF [Pseudoduganella lurida]|uniref:Conjugation peptidase TraF n=1 Tax=Pseudoduganella lurida TaxID=1036180 RepID=A0A562R0F0_9BURK|nr:conjugative transfer signal peptidase TraF [Pseudoduganella lurida]TWI62545.1 conjugation peptidase TraF [Pseudoduganella lurida]